MRKSLPISGGTLFEVHWTTGVRSIPRLMSLTGVSRATAYRYANQMQTKGSIERIPKLKNSILKHWRQLSPAMLEPYIDSMEDRFRQVIERQGSYINY